MAIWSPSPARNGPDVSTDTPLSEYTCISSYIQQKLKLSAEKCLIHVYRWQMDNIAKL